MLRRALPVTVVKPLAESEISPVAGVPFLPTKNQFLGKVFLLTGYQALYTIPQMGRQTGTVKWFNSACCHLSFSGHFSLRRGIYWRNVVDGGFIR
jgi:hypothetical protein